MEGSSLIIFRRCDVTLIFDWSSERESKCRIELREGPAHLPSHIFFIVFLFHSHPRR